MQSSLKHKSTTISIAVAVVLRSVMNIAKNVTSTRSSFEVKPDRRFETRQVVLGWRKHRNECGNTFVCRFDLLVIASAKRVNIPDVQTVMLYWFLDKNELKFAIHFSKLYRVKEYSCS